MKENKIGIISTLVIAFLSLIFTFLPYFPNIDGNFWLVIWGVNFSFAIFGSALISLVVFLINYLAQRNMMISSVSKHFYKLASSFLLASNKNNITEFVNLMDDFNKAITDLYNDCYDYPRLANGMFRISKKEKKLYKQLKGLTQSIFNLIFAYRCPVNYLLENTKLAQFFIDNNVLPVKEKVKDVLDNILKIQDIYLGRNFLSDNEMKNFYEKNFGEFKNEQN